MSIADTEEEALKIGVVEMKSCMCLYKMLLITNLLSDKLLEFPPHFLPLQVKCFGASG